MHWRGIHLPCCLPIRLPHTILYAVYLETHFIFSKEASSKHPIFFFKTILVWFTCKELLKFIQPYKMLCRSHQSEERGKNQCDNLDCDAFYFMWCQHFKAHWSSAREIWNILRGAWCLCYKPSPTIDSLAQCSHAACQCFLLACSLAAFCVSSGDLHCLPNEI